MRNSATGRGSEAVDKKGLEEREGGQVNKIQSESCSVRGALLSWLCSQDLLLFARSADGAAEKSDGVQKNITKAALRSLLRTPVSFHLTVHC